LKTISVGRNKGLSSTVNSDGQYHRAEAHGESSVEKWLKDAKVKTWVDFLKRESLTCFYTIKQF
jgi:hypothetical protein